MELLQFISKNRQTSLLLMGKDGVCMKEDALDLSKALLKSENLDVHPDFLYVSSETASIGVDDVLPIIEKGVQPPSVAEKAVVVIDEMHKMTVAAQNKLLLLLENSPYIFVVGICCEDSILQTVKSRMRIISYLPLTKKEFALQSNLPQEDVEIFFYASGGSLELLEKLLESKEIFHALKMSSLYHSSESRSKILEILHLVKEKDKEAVTNDPILMKAVIRLLAHVFTKLSMEACMKRTADMNRFLDIASMLVTEEGRISSQGYTKNDFFRAIVYCIEH